MSLTTTYLPKYGLVGENVTVDFTFKSYQQYWGADWEYPLKIHKLEIEISGPFPSGISYEETIAIDKVLDYLEELKHIIEVRPTGNGEVTCSIYISFESNDLAHKGSMDERLERLTFPIATARFTMYDDLHDDYVNSQNNINAIQNQLNITRILMYILIASTLGFLFTTVYFAAKKSKMKQSSKMK